MFQWQTELDIKTMRHGAGGSAMIRLTSIKRNSTNVKLNLFTTLLSKALPSLTSHFIGRPAPTPSTTLVYYLNNSAQLRLTTSAQVGSNSMKAIVTPTTALASFINFFIFLFAIAASTGWMCVLEILFLVKIVPQPMTQCHRHY